MKKLLFLFIFLPTLAWGQRDTVWSIRYQNAHWRPPPVKKFEITPEIATSSVIIGTFLVNDAIIVRGLYNNDPYIMKKTAIIYVTGCALSVGTYFLVKKLRE